MSSIPVRRRTARGTLMTLTLGHTAADLSSGALWALLPFLVAERDYSYAVVGVFALTASVASALFQPLIGAHGDALEPPSRRGALNARPGALPGAASARTLRAWTRAD